MNSINDDNDACGGTMAFDSESPIFPDNDGIEPESNNDRNDVEKENIDNTYLEMYYEDLKLGIFKERPITRGRSEYGLEDPTEKIRTRSALLCEDFIKSIKQRFAETPSVVISMRNCLDPAQLFTSDPKLNPQYGVKELDDLILFTKQNAPLTLNIDFDIVRDQYQLWKTSFLHEIQDKNMRDLWMRKDKVVSTLVMKTYFISEILANKIEEFLYFYSLMILKVRSEAVCECAASVMKIHIHQNRALDHDSLNDEVLIHWNAPPLHLATQFIEESLDLYFNRLQDKHWLFFKKTEMYRVWSLVRPGSVVLHRLRQQQTVRLPSPQSI